VGRSNIYSKVKRLALRVRTWLFNVRAWLSKDNNYLKNAAYIVAIVALTITAVQASLAKSELELSKADLEARTRPYLSIENIGLNDTGEGWISINITINNLGEIPATRVRLGGVYLDGNPIALSSRPAEDYPVIVHTIGDGVNITINRTLVVSYADLPDDMIFFPQKPTTITLPVSGSIRESAITDGSIIDIELKYAWGDRQYWYMATVMLSEGQWKVILERGD
jgi:hypothetical protein